MAIRPLTFGLAMVSAIMETCNMLVTGSHSTVLLITVMEAIVELTVLQPLVMEHARLIHVELESVLVLIRNTGVLALEILLERIVKQLLMVVLAAPVTMVLVVSVISQRPTIFYVFVKDSITIPPVVQPFPLVVAVPQQHVPHHVPMEIVLLPITVLVTLDIMEQGRLAL